MTKLVRDLSTPENREYWRRMEETARKVESWPDWKRAGINVAQLRSQPRTSPEEDAAARKEVAERVSG